MFQLIIRKWFVLFALLTFVNVVSYAQTKEGYTMDVRLITSQVKSGVIIEEYLISTSDTSEVSVLLGRKKKEKVLPTIFEVNIYNSDWEEYGLITRVKWGYNAVIMSPRGKKKSTTPFHPFKNIGKDAVKVIDWIIEQSWSNQEIGMIGGSHGAWSIWNTLKTNHPAIKTALPIAAPVWGMDAIRLNGIGYIDNLRWDKLIRNKSYSDWNSYFDESYWYNFSKRWYETGLSFHQLDSLEGQKSPFFQEWLEHQLFDNYWSDLIPTDQEFSKINIPILSMTGYYDGNQTGSLHYYRNHVKNTSDSLHYLFIGPYTHFGVQGKKPSTTLGTSKIDGVAVLNLDKLRKQWFDYILKKGKKPSILKDHISYEVMGKNKWCYSPNLKAISNDTITFHLSKINYDGDFVMDTITPKSDEIILDGTTYYNDRSDFYHYSKTTKNHIIDTVLNVEDNIVFSTPPFSESIILSNTMFGNLRFRVNKEDADIKISVYEKTKEGVYTLLLNHSFRSSFILNHGVPQPLERNGVTNVPINNTTFTSKRIKKGSEIILAIKIHKSPFTDLGNGKYQSYPLKIDWLTGSYLSIPVRR